MNTKKVKKLRKQIGYHPSQPRGYEHVKARNGRVCVELHEDCSRYMYQQLKKDL